MFCSPIEKINSWGKRATSSARVARLIAAIPPVCAVCAACAASPPPLDSAPGTSTLATDPALDFAFDSLDDRPVSAAATRGKLTVICFVTTDSLPGQAQVDFLVPMAKHDADRVNYAVVVVGTDRELVELYTKSLSLKFPVAWLEPTQAAVAEGFGDIGVVPVTVLLDQGGHPVWRAQGRVARPDEMRKAMDLVR
jgi:hypothetical protein